MQQENKSKIAAKDIAAIGMMVAVIEVCKFVMAPIPNIELTTFWLILFTLYFGRRIALVVPVFILLEGLIYGFGSWWVMYLYIWPSLVLISRIFRKQESVWFWSILSALYGFLFGFYCAIPYVVIGAVDGGLRSGLQAGFTWWIAGIPWDLVHGIGNFVIMLVLYYPIKRIMGKIRF